MNATPQRPVQSTPPFENDSPWAPFGQRAFAVLWWATMLSNMGTWMHDVGAGWLMTTLDSTPNIVAAVQAATTLPVVLFALPAGAIADIVDRRRLLISVNLFMALTAASLALLLMFGAVTPTILLVFTFLLGTGAAFIAPTWQAIIPSLVPRQQLPAAIALNSVGINVSRATGPAIAGFLIVSIGMVAPFALNALSFIGIIAALVWWRPPPVAPSSLPHERFASAMVVGLRYGLNSGPLKATLIRAGAFFMFASALWALLPLIARELLGGDARLYGILLASIGAGAVLAAFALPTIKAHLGPNTSVAAGCAGTAVSLAILAITHDKFVAIGAAALAGVCWTGVLSSLYVSAHVSLPEWVRARGLSIYLIVFFGSMSLGSIIWGQVATLTSIETALLIASVGIAAFIPLTWRAKLNQGDALDLNPSMHWPATSTFEGNANGRGRVMIQITYKIAEPDRSRFLQLMQELSKSRRRHSAYDWAIVESLETPGTFVETWFEASWVEHMRHHERISMADKVIQDQIRRLHQNDGPPVVRHFMTPSQKPRSKSTNT
ncbi:MAG: MFS transporter [Hyphomicrobiaceae bacterium]|nr:MFS transporter [Hyphomicrobiaceae bacterium]